MAIPAEKNSTPMHPGEPYNAERTDQADTVLPESELTHLDIHLGSEVSEFLENYPFCYRAFAEGVSFKDFGFHSFVVSEGALEIFKAAKTELERTGNVEDLKFFLSLIPTALAGGGLLHDIGKTSTIENLRESMLLHPKFGQNERPKHAVIVDHLHGPVGGFMCQILHAPQEIVEIVMDIHEQPNGHWRTFDGRWQYSYPRPRSRSTGLTQLIHECVRLADLAASMGFPRPYRPDGRDIFPTDLIEKALWDRLNLYKDSYFTNDMKNVLHAATMKYLAYAQKTYGTASLRTTDNTSYYLADGMYLKPLDPLIIDYVSNLILVDEDPIYQYYRERIKAFKEKHIEDLLQENAVAE